MAETRPLVLTLTEDPKRIQPIIDMLKASYRVESPTTADDALELLGSKNVSLVLVDTFVGGSSGPELLNPILHRLLETQVVMLADRKTAPTAIKGLAMGASNVLFKDLDPHMIKLLVDKAYEAFLRQRELLYLRNEVEKNTPSDFIVGKNSRMKEIYNLVLQEGKGKNHLVICGERGCGKESIARLIYREGPATKGPFVSMHLASYPPNAVEFLLFGFEKRRQSDKTEEGIGRMELAQSGVLFLDDIDLMKPDVQKRLAEAVTEGGYSRRGGSRRIPLTMRIIASSCLSPAELGSGSGVSSELFKALSDVVVEVPPLRDRSEDLPRYIEQFLTRYNIKYHKQVEEFSRKAIKVLEDYPWPGNLTQLEALVETLVLQTERQIIQDVDIPVEYHLANLGKPGYEKVDMLKTANDIFEKNFLIRMMESTRWNQTKSAEILGIHVNTLKYKMEKLGLFDVLYEEKGKRKRRRKDSTSDVSETTEL